MIKIITITIITKKENINKDAVATFLCIFLLENIYIFIIDQQNFRLHLMMYTRPYLISLSKRFHSFRAACRGLNQDFLFFRLFRSVFFYSYAVVVNVVAVTSIIIIIIHIDDEQYR